MAGTIYLLFWCLNDDSNRKENQGRGEDRDKQPTLLHDRRGKRRLGGHASRVETVQAGSGHAAASLRFHAVLQELLLPIVVMRSCGPANLKKIIFKLIDS